MDALEMTLLFDYYGDLLTERQRACLDLRYNQDLSLGEISQELGVSRQGVYDNLNRAESILRDMENKTGFVNRSIKTRKLKTIILTAAEKLADNPDPDISGLAAEILAAARELEE